NNSLGVNAEVLSTDFGTGLDLLADVICHPIFPVNELERERAIQLAGIRAQKDNLLQSASKAMRRALFGSAAYGLDVSGAETSVQKLQAADLKSFHEKLIAPNNCVLAIFGDIQSDDVRASVEKVFGNWKANPAANLTLDFGPGTLDSTKRVSETHDKKQAVLLI